ncbi:MAG: hypothetical protein QOI41_3278, partial [Myxococcales bacterium]|nr:hypothetical protein [Myxococcales bacterium]
EELREARRERLGARRGREPARVPYDQRVTEDVAQASERVRDRRLRDDISGRGRGLAGGT